jgi:hypothetical protein
VSHSCSDGISLLHLTDGFPRGRIEKVPILPVALDNRLGSELAQPLDVSRHVAEILSLTSVPWSETVEPGLKEDVRCRYEFVELPASEFQAFDRDQRKLSGFSDTLWRSSILAFAALNSANSHFGCTTCVNLRPFLDIPSFGNCFAPLCVVANDATKEMTVADLDRRLREDFNSKMKQRAYSNSIKASLGGFLGARKGAAFINVSNVGTFHVAHPITDLWAQHTMKSREIEGEYALLALAIEADGQTKVVIRLQSPPTVVNGQDAARTFKAILHGLRSIRSKSTIGDAIREIREFVFT